MAENVIQVKSISELLGMKFFIPSYQRGYRWTEQQVKDLLNDIKKFESPDETKYCLQPLVVAEMTEDKKNKLNIESNDVWYEVIDGQQRLTTIFLILNIENDENLFLKYETRSESENYIKNIKQQNEATNIDFHFMLEAKKTIEKFFQNSCSEDIISFIKKLKDNCSIIWYKTEENAYEVFKRLNSGKIGLSNAELVKALLLKKDNFSSSEDKQKEMASEWDRMEQHLHEDPFWYFINPDPENPRFDKTRIDFLLEMTLRCDNKTVDEGIQKNEYYIFLTYNEKIVSDGWKSIWELIVKNFRIFKYWYDKRDIYHLIGYLTLSNKGSLEIITELMKLSNSPKNEFKKELQLECLKSLNSWEKEKKELHFEGLTYKKDKDKQKIHNILLLFNLATVQNQISEVSRYPFNEHYQATKSKWSLEHIHAQNEKQIKWDEKSFTKIKSYLKNISVAGIDNLNKFLEDKKTLEQISDDAKREAIYKAIIGAFMGKSIKADNKGNITSDFEKDDHLTNLALLQSDKNAAFNNKTYPEKREKLAEYENTESKSAFVPICTRNAFFKHYSPDSTNPLVWDEKAGQDYVTAITNVIAAYLEVSPFQEGHGEDFKYGLKK